MNMRGNGSGRTTRALVALSRSAELMGQMFPVAQLGNGSLPEFGCQLVNDTLGDAGQRLQACTVRSAGSESEQVIAAHGGRPGSAGASSHVMG